MALRASLLRVMGLTWMLLLGSLGEGPLHAQDRGAPRFGPSPDTSDAEAVDGGRLWSVTTPPFARFDQRYGVSADSAWATHLRRGVLRLPQCSAALVSASGLALTAAECVRDALEDGAGPVVAEQRAEERALPGLHADRLVATTDVTAAVRAARQDTTRHQAIATVQQRLQSEARPRQHVQVEADAGGTTYTAYTYRRYEDLRLAFLPEQSVSAFGGLEAAMSYPRQALDVALLRVYTADGTPLRSTHFFESPTRALRPGDAVFAVGHPASTRRAESADQLAVRRDLVLPNRRALLSTWTDAVGTYLDTTAEAAPSWARAVREGATMHKRVGARLEALQTESVMARLRRRDDELREALRQEARLEKQHGRVLDSLLAIQSEKRSLAPAYRAFGTFGVEAYSSTTFRRMMQALRAREDGGGDPVSGDGLSLPLAGPTRPPAIETALLADRLRRMTAFLRPDTAAVERLLGGHTPAELAARIVRRSVLASPTYTPGGRLIVPPEDPAATLVDVVGPRVRSFLTDWSRLARAERSLTRRLARARQAVRTSSLRPSGDRSPRLTDGRVRGYPYNGTVAPPFTTFYGLYGQSRAFGDEAPWALPDRWRQASSGLDRSVPLTLVASTDPVGATPGAPLLSKSLELVGVAIGPNIQGVAGAYLFLPERMRTVAVDLRGLRLSLRAIYGADRLVGELFGEATSAPRPNR